MKKILLICLIFSSKAFAQLPVDSNTHLVTYSGIVTVNGTQEELYSRAREWFAKTYNSAQNVIQMDSKDKIVGKALMQAYYKGGDYGYINYTISLYLKDGKYKYEISNFYHTGEAVVGSYVGIPDYGTCEEMMNEKNKHAQKVGYALITQLDENIKSLIADLELNMNNKVTAKDW